MKYLILALAIASVHAENLSLGFLASETSWNAKFTDLQTPGWNTTMHPGGILDLQYGHIYAEVGGDPHRPRETTTIAAGLRGDLLHHGRVALYGQASVGVMWAPSFLEYCANYEYRNGDCGAGDKEPEYCPWATANVGLGVRIKIKPTFALEPARIEYLSPYAIGPRWRFSAGFRVYLK